MYMRALATTAVLAVACSSDTPIAPPDAGPVLPDGVYQLRDVEAPLPATDFGPLLDMIGDARVIALGEELHTTRGFSRMKVLAFTYLVEHAGVRVFAFENPRRGAAHVQAYLDACTAGTASVDADADAAVRRLFGVWANESVRELAVWMCRYNEQHPDDPLMFVGFDVQEPCHDAVSLHDFLARVGVDDNEGFDDVTACDNVPASLVCTGLVQTVITPEANDQCTRGLDALDAVFAARRDEWIAGTSEREVELARLDLLSLRAWHDSIWHDQQGDERASLEARDAGMAEAFEILRTQSFPDARVAIWAHNWHIATRNDARTDEYAFRSMGTWLGEQLGEDYAAVGLVAYEMVLNWPGLHVGPIPAQTGERAVERLLHELAPLHAPDTALLVDLDGPMFAPPARFSIGDDPGDRGGGPSRPTAGAFPRAPLPRPCRRHARAAVGQRAAGHRRRTTPRAAHR